MKKFAFSRGFSLVESAIALVVVGFIALAFVAFWRTAGQQKTAIAERDLLSRAQAALTGFAYAKYRLPCPASDAEGRA